MTLEELRERFPIGCKVMYNGREETVVGYDGLNPEKTSFPLVVSSPSGWRVNVLDSKYQSFCDTAFTGSARWTSLDEVTRIDTPTCKVGDEVVFKVGDIELKYYVCFNHFTLKGSGSNDTVFAPLCLDKGDFCSEAYGYPHKGGDWPCFHDGDMQAAQRVIDALQEECRKFNEKLEKPEEAKPVDARVPASKKGWKVGDRFKVIFVEDERASLGDILELTEDDGTVCPWFFNITQEKRNVPVFTDHLEPVAREGPVELYEALPIPEGLDVVYLEVVKDIIPENLTGDGQCRGILSTVMSKGSRSWIAKDSWRSQEDLCCPEKNRWFANIPKEYFKEVELVEETAAVPETAIDMKAIQEECKRRYPIGCRYRCATGDGQVEDLESDAITYRVTFSQNKVMAHSLGGYLYYKGKWAELVSLPEKSVPVDELVPSIAGEGILSQITKAPKPVSSKRLTPPIIINK